ncbi:unnamed protein product, partial [Symbiodinium necroappetens]
MPSSLQLPADCIGKDGLPPEHGVAAQIQEAKRMDAIVSVPRPKVIVDTDPGRDDIFALLWACSLAKKGAIEIAVVTTAQGNVRAHLTCVGAEDSVGQSQGPELQFMRSGFAVSA